MSPVDARDDKEARVVFVGSTNNAFVFSISHVKVFIWVVDATSPSFRSVGTFTARFKPELDDICCLVWDNISKTLVDVPFCFLAVAVAQAEAVGC